ncbi:hypothetical protein ES703_42745 [subsurface metagenome]
MTSKGHALAREELIRALTAYTGITTADGAEDGTSLIDSNLIGKNDFITEKTIIIITGDAANEDKGAESFNDENGAIILQGIGFSHQIVKGTIFRVLNISSVEIDVGRIEAKIDALITLADVLALTTFKQETVAATDVNGTAWKDLLDKSTITKPVKICGFKVTVAGTWAGKARIRITDGAGNKIFPFQDYYEQDTDFTSGMQAVFNFPVVVPVADGYKFQFCSSNGADGAGDTLQLNNLDIIEIG